jgi:hypothetical protein
MLEPERYDAVNNADEPYSTKLVEGLVVVQTIAAEELPS